NRLAPHVSFSTLLCAFLARVTGRGEISGHEPAALPSLLPHRDPRPLPFKHTPTRPFYPILTLRPTSPHPSAASIPLRRAPPRRASAPAQSHRSTTFQPTRATVE